MLVGRDGQEIEEICGERLAEEIDEVGGVGGGFQAEVRGDEGVWGGGEGWGEGGW